MRQNLAQIKHCLYLWIICSVASLFSVIFFQVFQWKFPQFSATQNLKCSNYMEKTVKKTDKLLKRAVSFQVSNKQNLRFNSSVCLLIIIFFFYWGICENNSLPMMLYKKCNQSEQAWHTKINKATTFNSAHSNKAAQMSLSLKSPQ